MTKELPIVKDIEISFEHAIKNGNKKIALEAFKLLKKHYHKLLKKYHKEVKKNGR